MFHETTTMHHPGCSAAGDMPFYTQGCANIGYQHTQEGGHLVARIKYFGFELSTTPSLLDRTSPDLENEAALHLLSLAAQRFPEVTRAWTEAVRTAQERGTAPKKGPTRLKQGQVLWLLSPQQQNELQALPGRGFARTPEVEAYLMALQQVRHLWFARGI